MSTSTSENASIVRTLFDLFFFQGIAKIRSQRRRIWLRRGPLFSWCSNRRTTSRVSRLRGTPCLFRRATRGANFDGRDGERGTWLLHIHRWSQGHHGGNRQNYQRHYLTQPPLQRIRRSNDSGDACKNVNPINCSRLSLTELYAAFFLWIVMI